VTGEQASLCACRSRGAPVRFTAVGRIFVLAWFATFGLLPTTVAQQLAPVSNDTVEAHLGRGYAALKAEQYDAAVSEFRAALKLDPTLTTRARFPLAVALFNAKQTAEARAEFETVRRETGDHPNVVYYLGRLDLMDQDYPAAIRNLTKALAKPPYPDTAYYLGFACFKQGDFANAATYLKLAIAGNPGDSIAQYQLGLLLRKLGREDEAKRAFETSSELRRRDTDTSQLRVECGRLLDQGSVAEARAVCNRLYDPSSADRLTILGTLYGQHGDFEAALPLIQRAAELEPQSPQMQYNLALTYFRMDQPEKARAPLEKAVARWPDVFPLNFLYGAVLARLGEDRLAYSALVRARKLNQQDAVTFELLYQTTLRLARASASAGDQFAAIRYYQEAAALRPLDPEPHRGLAEVHASMGNAREAAAERQEADRLSRAGGGVP
jgi:Flp pilus assembly protein TadD